MNMIANPKGTTANTTTTPGGENRAQAHKRHIIEIVLWCIGFIVLVISTVAVHYHPKPWPIDLQTTITLQHAHLWGGLLAFIAFLSSINDPIPSTVALVLWFVGLLIFRKVQPALFIALGSAAADGVDGLVRLYANRPRPSAPFVHVYMPEPFTSFPSGHTEHDMVYYGFLLYLSFTKPVRTWRYYRWLLPLQLFCVLAILGIGLSRIMEGSHWLTDALAGYLCGLLLLYGLIFLDRYTTEKGAERRAKKQGAAVQSAK